MVLAVRVKNNLQFLKKSLSTPNLKRYLNRASDDQILTIVEVCFNLINHRYLLTQRQLQSLKKFAPQIRILAKVRTRQRAENILNALPAIFYSHLLTPLFKK